MREQEEGAAQGLELLVRGDTRWWLFILVVVSVPLALVFMPEDWSASRKLAGGMLAGVGSLFCVFLPRMIGGRDFN